MPVLRHRLTGEYRDRQGPQPGVESLSESISRYRFADIDMRGHGTGMDTGIGAACGVQYGGFARDGGNRCFDRLLDAGSVGLALPAHERATIIFDGEPEARQNRVPGGIAKPRNRSAGLIIALPAR